MDVNSVAFKSKCSFLVTPRYELFLSLAAASSDQPHTPPPLKLWKTEIDDFFNGLTAEIKAGLRLSTVVASFYPSLEADLSINQLITFLQDITPERFTFLFLDGLLHDKEISKAVVRKEIDLKVGINRVAQKKREWLTYIGMYPYDAKSVLLRFLESLIHNQEATKGLIIDCYRIWAERIFLKFWEAKKADLKSSSIRHKGLFQKMDFDEFSSQAFLKIRLGPKGDAIEAMRGGYKIDCRDIEKVFFIPSAFNMDRIWSSIERPEDSNVVYFPYLDIDLLQELGIPKPVNKVDPLLMCKAIGDPTRFALVSMLAQDPQPAVLLAEKLGLSRATISHHVSILKESGILEDDGKGRQLRIQWSTLAGLSENLVSSIRKTRK